MMDVLSDHLSQIKAWTLFCYGLLDLIMGGWLIYRGRQEWPERTRIPGRLVLGIFLIFVTYREWDVAVGLLRYGRTLRAVQAGTDALSVWPLVVGLVFGAWAAIRFVRNTVGPPALPPPSVVALERTADAAVRTADASERSATATEAIAEQGINGGRGQTG